MSPRIQRAEPPYMQIAAHFRKQIADGTLAVGDPLPSIQAIASESKGASKVSPTTVHRAFQLLQTEGLVTSTTQGTVVAAPRHTTGPDRLAMLKAGGQGMRPGEQVEILIADTAPTDELVAELLGVEVGSMAIRRRRVYRDRLGVVTVSTSWLPRELLELAPELVSKESLPMMTMGLVHERTGREYTYQFDIVTNRPAPADIAEILGVEPGSRELTMVTVYRDQDGVPVEVGVDYLAPGRELTAEHTLV